MTGRITEVHREAQKRLLAALSEEKRQSRTKHLQWCKDRANEYAYAGNLRDAVSSMISDLQKWDHGPMYDLELIKLMFQDGVHFRKSRDDMLHWIDGFN